MSGVTPVEMPLTVVSTSTVPLTSPCSAGLPVTTAGSNPNSSPLALTCKALSASAASNVNCGIRPPKIADPVSVPLAVRSVVSGVAPCPLATMCPLIALVYRSVANAAILNDSPIFSRSRSATVASVS